MYLWSFYEQIKHVIVFLGGSFAKNAQGEFLRSSGICLLLERGDTIIENNNKRVIFRIYALWFEMSQF